MAWCVSCPGSFFLKGMDGGMNWRPGAPAPLGGGFDIVPCRDASFCRWGDPDWTSEVDRPDVGVPEEVAALRWFPAVFVDCVLAAGVDRWEDCELGSLEARLGAFLGGPPGTVPF